MPKGFGGLSEKALMFVIQARLIASSVFARSAQLKEAAKATVKPLAPLPPYKVAQRKSRERQRRSHVHPPQAPGSRYWTCDGQGYEWQPNGSLRRIDDPAPEGYLERVQALWH